MYSYVKRLLDIFFALVISLFFLPFGMIIALLIMLESKGSALFVQRRPGKGGKMFGVYKFRTMKIQTDPCENIADTHRITPFGNILRKSSLDEIPQMINIIKGDMSFIGPRPLLEEYIPRYSPNQMRRHEVRPGITGWAQVNGRNAISWEEKFDLDVWYVDHQSFRLDAKIFVMTFQTILRRRGVNQSQNTTMLPFMGSNKDEG